MVLVRSYPELAFYIEMFRDGKADFLLIEGDAGLGKSQMVERLMQDTSHLFVSSHTTPLALYINGFIHKDQPIIFDDTDNLMTNKDNVALLRQFAETRQEKMISWFTTSNKLPSEIPQQYTTRSRVLVICNDFSYINKYVSALKDRGFHIQFKPSKDELLKKIRAIAGRIENDLASQEKDEVINFLAKWLPYADITLRSFVKACSLYKYCKERQLNWQEKAMSDIALDEKLVLVDKLLQQDISDMDRVKLWQDSGWSERSYWYKKKEFLSRSGTAKVQLIV